MFQAGGIMSPWGASAFNSATAGSVLGELGGSIFGSVVDKGVSKLVGSMFGGGKKDNSAPSGWQQVELDNARFAANQRMQYDFAKKAIRWRAADAKVAGLHPLAVLGVSPSSASPVHVSGGRNATGLEVSSEGNGTVSRRLSRAYQQELVMNRQSHLADLEVKAAQADSLRSQAQANRYGMQLDYANHMMNRYNNWQSALLNSYRAQLDGRRLSMDQLSTLREWQRHKIESRYNYGHESGPLDPFNYFYHPDYGNFRVFKPEISEGMQGTPMFGATMYDWFRHGDRNPIRPKFKHRSRKKRAKYNRSNLR
jgi:hypothetical protein